jgi:hypothetical protein
MTTINPAIGRLLAGFGGALLIASLFLTWSEGAAGSQDGWGAADIWDVFLAITGACGVAAAVTGGRFGFFRPDLSFNAMTDIFGVMASILLVWFIFDVPAGASREAGVYLALLGAALVATGAGDFRVRSVFPRMPEAEPPPG